MQPVIHSWKLRQLDCEYKTSLSYMVSSRLARDAQKDPISEKNN
jgi:hypothetical protein